MFRVEHNETFQVVEHLGKGINSSRDDYGLVFDKEGTSGFFTSNREGGNGLEDIYGFTLKPSARFAAVLEGENEPTANKISTAAIKETEEKAVEIQEAEVTTATKDINTLDEKEVPITAAMEVEEEMTTEIVPFAGQELADDESKMTVFSIQVAAYSKDWGGYDKLADDLKHLGKVYKVYYANMIKIRVGSFKRETDARAALAKVKQKGYKDAFLVKEELVIKTVPKSTTATEVKEAPVETYKQEKQPIQQEPANDILRSAPQKAEEEAFEIDEERLKDMPVYRIRVAAYTNPEWFNKKKVAHLGDIHKELQGEWHIFYVGDFKTIEEAEQVKIQVKDAGYNAAQLYMLRDGELIKVR